MPAPLPALAGGPPPVGSGTIPEGPPPEALAPPGGGGYAPGGAPVGPKKKGRGCLIAGVITAVLVVAGLLGGALWLFGLGGKKVKSVARKHLPDSCEAVVRVDITQLLKVKPIKKHVVPAIEEVAVEEGGTQLARFLITARMNPNKDLKEMVICLQDIEVGSDPDFGIVIGGKLLDKGGVIKALDKHDDDDELGKPKKIDGMLVVEDREEGVLVSQAKKDAALLLTNNKSMLKKVAKTSSAYKDTFDIPLDEQISGVIAEGVVGKLVPFQLRLAGLSGLDDIGRVELVATLDPGEVGMRASLPNAKTASKLATTIKSFVRTAALIPGGGGRAGQVIKALANAKIEADGSDLVIEVPISDEDIEDFAKDIAKEIRERDK